MKLDTPYFTKGKIETMELLTLSHELYHAI